MAGSPISIRTCRPGPEGSWSPRSAIEADLRKIKTDWARRRVWVCQRCGREDGEIPKQIVLVGSTIPEGVSLFRLTQRPRTLLCTEAFAEAARRLAFTNILFEPVRTDGSETTQGLARAQASRPELWSSSESKPSRKRRAAGARPTAEAARVKKAPPFPAIDSVLRSPALRRQAEALRALVRPCLHLAFHPAPKVPLGASHFGGLPDLPKEVTWPGARGIQLDFVAQLNCGDSGRLYLWIRREDLQAQRFDRCWVLVQCY